MREVERISDQLERAFEGNAWHGQALLEVLSDVANEKAARKPLHSAHSIWEIVLHIGVWQSVVRRRLQGEVIRELAPDRDWPRVVDTSEEAWQNTIVSLKRGNEELREAITRLNDNQLAQTVPGEDYAFYVMLHGVVQHDLYHAGQIAILKKAA